MLHGEISEEGIIKSFYLAIKEKNLVALFFQLPGRPVKVGDTWPLDIQLLSTDQGFVCDSSYRKNEVRVVSISDKDSEHIVTLNYNIIEYVHGSYKMPFFGNGPQESHSKYTFSGIAHFSIEKGKWLEWRDAPERTDSSRSNKPVVPDLDLDEEESFIVGRLVSTDVIEHETDHALDYGDYGVMSSRLALS